MPNDDEYVPVGVVEGSTEQLDKMREFAVQLKRIRRQLENLVDNYFSDTGMKYYLGEEIDGLFSRIDTAVEVALKKEIADYFTTDTSKETKQIKSIAEMFDETITQSIDEQKQKIFGQLIDIVKEHDDNPSEDFLIKSIDLLYYFDLGSLLG